MPKTIIEKIWDNHLVVNGGVEKPSLIFIDLHLVHEVTSPQAFEGLALSGRKVRHPELTLAVADHGYVLEMGEIGLHGPADELASAGRVRQRNLYRLTRQLLTDEDPETLRSNVRCGLLAIVVIVAGTAWLLASLLGRPTR